MRVQYNSKIILCAALLFGLSILLNALNSSVLSWTIYGIKKSSVLSGFVSSFRIFVLVYLIIKIAIIGRPINWLNSKTIDLFFLSIIPFISISFSNLIFNSFFYAIWYFLAIYTLILIITALNKFEFPDIVKSLKKIFWYLVPTLVLISFLFIINIDNLILGQSYYIAYTGKTFYPYLILFIGSVQCALFELERFTEDPYRSKYFPLIIHAIFLLLYMLILLVSGRRTPTIVFLLILFIHLGKVLSGKFVQIKYLIPIILILLIYTNWNSISNSQIFASLNRVTSLEISDGEILEGHSDSLASRLEIWSQYYLVWKENPLFGSGLTSSIEVQKEMFSRSELSGFSPHSTFVGYLADLGIYGFIFFVIVIGRTIMYFSKIPRKLRALSFYFLLQLLVINLFEYNVSPGQVFFWPTWFGIGLIRVLSVP